MKVETRTLSDELLDLAKRARGEGLFISAYEADFLLAAVKRIRDLETTVDTMTALNNDKFRHLQAYCRAADEDKATIRRLEQERDGYHAGLRLYQACKDDVPWGEVTSVESWVKAAASLKVEPCPPMSEGER